MTPQAAGTLAGAFADRALAEAVAIVERWRLPVGVLASVVLHGLRAAARDLDTVDAARIQPAAPAMERRTRPKARSKRRRA